MANKSVVKEQNIRSISSNEILKGNYSNAFRVSNSDTETIIDFAFASDNDGEKVANVVSRIIMRPEFAKSLGEKIVAIYAKNKHEATHDKK